MKKVLTLATIMTFVLAVAGAAFAADVAGKVEVKDKAVSVKVSEAKGDDGKAIADLKDKVVAVTGAKIEDVKKLAGKDVELKGKLGKDNKEIDVASVAEKKAAPAPAPAPKPAPKPAPEKKK